MLLLVHFAFRTVPKNSHHTFAIFDITLLFSFKNSSEVVHLSETVFHHPAQLCWWKQQQNKH
jgi:hypothetical protein